MSGNLRFPSKPTEFIDWGRQNLPSVAWNLPGMAWNLPGMPGKVVSATAAQTLPSHVLGVRMTVVKLTPSNYIRGYGYAGFGKCRVSRIGTPALVFSSFTGTGEQLQLDRFTEAYHIFSSESTALCMISICLHGQHVFRYRHLWTSKQNYCTLELVLANSGIQAPKVSGASLLLCGGERRTAD